MALSGDKGYKNKKKRFDKIVHDIKNVKIQGAKDVARAALEAWSLFPNKQSKKILLSIRPTEPMLRNVLKFAGKKSLKEILKHFNESQDKINKSVLKLIKSGDIVFTHCHSNTVVDALIYAKKRGKKFQVYNTETRPLFQGRKTANELRKRKIPVTMFVDSALGIALSGEQGNKKPDKVFLGADALLKKGIINKVGSELVGIVAKKEKIPLYILADSWKFSNEKIALEKRNWKEVWKTSRKLINLKIQNPAFEFVPSKYITGGIITELGLMKYKDFLRKIEKTGKS